MAWRKANTVVGLKLKIHGTSIELGNFTGFPLVFADELLQVASDPWGKSFNYNGLNHNTNYDIIAGASAGSLDLRSYFYSLNTNESMYIYSDTFGETVNIEFQRTGSMSGNTYVNYYGQRSYGASLKIAVQNPDPGYIAWMGFALFVNDDTGEGTIVTCGNATYYMSGLGERADRYEQAGFGSTASPLTHVVYMIVAGHEIDPPTPGGGNPYEGGGLNDELAGGEDQNFEETSDTIAEPTLPSSPATGSGFITAYVPTLSEINDVADYLIDPSVLQALAGTVLKLSDVVIGLSIFPFTITASGSKEIKMNLCGVHLTTGVTCHYSNSQFVTLSMGTVEVKKYWDNCLDYDPYTRITLYLPYVGFVDLDTDEVMGKEVTVKYNVDIVTGCCLALIIVDGSVLYQYPGECSCQIPITSVSFDTFLQSAVQLGITAASGARAVKGAAGSVSQAGSSVLAAEGAGAQRLAMEDFNAERAKFAGIKADVGDSLISASVGAVLSAKGQYSHAGAMSSCAGILGTQKPFLIIKRPRQCMPEGYEGIRGFPCNMKATLSDLEGYTEVGDIHLNIPNATVQEIVECEQFLKEGVYL